MKYISCILLSLTNFLWALSYSSTPLTNDQILKELQYILDKTNKGQPLNESSKLEPELITLFDENISLDKIELIKISGNISPSRKPEQFVLIIPSNDNLPPISTLWNHKYAILLFYQFNKHKWTLFSANSFYNEIELIPVKENYSLIKVHLDKCIRGKCEWLTEIYSINSSGSISNVYHQNTFTDLDYISDLLLGLPSTENELKEIQEGDTLSYFQEEIKFNEEDLSETISISTFQKYEDKKIMIKTHYIKREYVFKENKFHLKKSYLLEEKTEILP